MLLSISIPVRAVVKVEKFGDNITYEEKLEIWCWVHALTPGHECPLYMVDE